MLAQHRRRDRVGLGRVPVRGLVGDVNNSGNINLIDVGAIKSNSRAAITSTTCVFDVNTDGNINLIDLAMTKSMYGNKAP